MDQNRDLKIEVKEKYMRSMDPDDEKGKGINCMS